MIGGARGIIAAGRVETELWAHDVAGLELSASIALDTSPQAETVETGLPPCCRFGTPQAAFAQRLRKKVF